MPLALITGAARADSIAAGIVPRLRSAGWTVVTSDLTDADHRADLSTVNGPDELIAEVNRQHGTIALSSSVTRTMSSPAFSTPPPPASTGTWR